MKLNELATASPTKQAAKVFESYFGDRINFDTINQAQTRAILRRVRGLVAEHRKTPDFHISERNPAYLKLVVMEQALSVRLQELDATPAQATAPNPQAAAMNVAQRRKQIDDQIKALQDQIRDLQQQRNMPAMGMAESRRRISESEVQQAQVVLAAQDMVDEVQKMSEQVSAMQFKDLPALTDSIKNQVGPDQAMQFNTDATAALAGLLQNLQGARQQLDQALGVVTGQAPTVPGVDADTVGLDTDLPAELPDGEEEIDVDVDTDIEVDDEKDSNTLATSLGRARR
jgi:hypothetical protein